MDTVNLDCNTCAHHEQGRSIDDVPEVCHECMRITTQGLGHLPFWKRADAEPPRAMGDTPVAAPAGNPKDAIGSKKIPLGNIPAVAAVEVSKALADGASKYGDYNWREAGIRATVYIDAMERHLAKLKAGEDLAQDSLVHHLGHIMANCAIWLDSELHGSLVDDRAHSPETVYALYEADEWMKENLE